MKELDLSIMLKVLGKSLSPCIQFFSLRLFQFFKNDVIFYNNHNFFLSKRAQEDNLPTDWTDIILNSKRLKWEFAENFKRILNDQKKRKITLKK